MGQMGRRRFLIASGAMLASKVARGERVFRVGILERGTSSKKERTRLWRSMLERLNELGYEEGRNLVVDYRRGTGEVASLSKLARELVATQPDAIVAVTTPVVRAAMAATASIPIVFPSAGNPVGSGLVKSLARPGGNVTGQSIIQTDTAAKRIELLLEVAPHAKRVVYIGPVRNRSVAAVYRELQKVASARGVELRHVDALNAQSIENVFARFSTETVDALVLSAILVSHRHRLAALAAEHHLPAIYVFLEHLDAGGLLTFGPDLRAMYRRTGELVHRILQGAKPADTPVEQVQFVVGVNLRAAKTLGLTVPQSILLRADRVIE